MAKEAPASTLSCTHKSCPTCGTLIADEFALWHLGEPKALQVESTTALCLTQQQLPWLLTDLQRKKHNVNSSHKTATHVLASRDQKKS